MLITSKGQITIPKKFREDLGLLPHTEIEFKQVKEGLVLRKVAKSVRGKKMIEAMMAHSAVAMSTNEIMDLTRGE